MTIWQTTGRPGRLKTAINTHGDPAAAFLKHAGSAPGHEVAAVHDDGCPCVEHAAALPACTCKVLWLLATEAA